MPVPFLKQVFLHFTCEGHTSVFHFMDFVTLVRLSEMIACSCAILSEWGEVLSFRGRYGAQRDSATAISTWGF